MLSELVGGYPGMRTNEAAQRDYPKAWGNCALLLMLAGIADVLCTQNLPAKDPPFGDQPDDLAARVGFLVHHFA